MLSGLSIYFNNVFEVTRVLPSDTAGSNVVLELSCSLRVEVTKSRRAFYSIPHGPKMFISAWASPGTDLCPLCGEPGDEVYNKFYCTNWKCRNFHDDREEVPF